MTHRVHPKAYRIKETKDWDSRGYYNKTAPEYLEEDFRIREFLRKKLGKIGVERIEIERFPGKINIIISSARPGLVIGRGGEGVEELKRELEKRIGVVSFKKTLSEETKRMKKKEKTSLGIKPEKRREIRIEIREIRNPWASASLSAQWIAQQIERRIAYRRVLKQALSRITPQKEIKGVRIQVSGRLNGAEIARREWVASGKLPRQTLRADIDYAKAEALCTYGVIGVKVWLYKGEKFD